MTTQRLYYDDSYTTEFNAKVLESTTVDNRSGIILDRTYFYPTGGGQPFDTGTLNGISVVDVFTRDEDKAVVHILAESLSATEVTGKLDWKRRFDFMQHHTGQHILTQAFVQTMAINTVGFHLSPDSVTIDLDTSPLTDEQIDAAEDVANQIIYENRAVHIRIQDLDDTEGVRIRRIPRHLLTEGLRIIEVEGFDTTACGGTHVAHTGEIGLVKILKVEKRGEKTRIEFLCGSRALNDYREKNRLANHLTVDLNCKFSETPHILANIREDLKTTQAALKVATFQLIENEASQLYNAALRSNNIVIITAAFENRGAAEIKNLASRLAANSKTIILIASTGEKVQFCFARSEDLSIDMGKLLREQLATLGGRGGGQPNFAQGGGISIEIEALRTLLGKIAAEVSLEER